MFASGPIVCVGTRKAGLSLSIDGGKTWKAYTEDNGIANNTINDVYLLGPSVYAATEDGLSVSTDRGEAGPSMIRGSGFAG